MPPDLRLIFPLKKMQVWSNIKHHLSNSRTKLAKKKAITAIELVGAGAALTGGSIMMEKMVE